MNRRTLFRSRNSKRRQQTTRVAEALEDRVLLAGNILVSFDAEVGVLSVTGDDEDNRFFVDRGTLIPSPGTTANGSDEPIDVGDDVQSIFIDMKGGNDFFLLQLNPIANDVELRGGDGDDGIILWGAPIGGDLLIKTGQGDDTVSVSESSPAFESLGDVGGNVKVNTGAGDDIVALGGAFGQSHGQWGFSIGQNLVVKTGDGHDQVGLSESTIGGDVLIKTRAGSDEVHAIGNTVGDRLKVKLGGGDDWAHMSENGVTGKLKVHGGSGIDNLFEEEGTYGRYVARNLESSESIADVDLFENHIHDTFWDVWR